MDAPTLAMPRRTVRSVAPEAAPLISNTRLAMLVLIFAVRETHAAPRQGAAGKVEAKASDVCNIRHTACHAE